MLVLMVAKGPDRGVRFELRGKSSVIIGRNSTDLALSDIMISRYHARLKEVNGRWYVRDLGSRNGTRLNGNRLLQTAMLREGDLISTGFTVLEFHVVPEPAIPSTPSRPPAPVEDDEPIELAELPSVNPAEVVSLDPADQPVEPQRPSTDDEELPGMSVAAPLDQSAESFAQDAQGWEMDESEEIDNRSDSKTESATVADVIGIAPPEPEIEPVTVAEPPATVEPVSVESIHDNQVIEEPAPLAAPAQPNEQPSAAMAMAVDQPSAALKQDEPSVPASPPLDDIHTPEVVSITVKPLAPETPPVAQAAEATVEANADARQVTPDSEQGVAVNSKLPSPDDEVEPISSPAAQVAMEAPAVVDEQSDLPSPQNDSVVEVSFQLPALQELTQGIDFQSSEVGGLDFAAVPDEAGMAWAEDSSPQVPTNVPAMDATGAQQQVVPPEPINSADGAAAAAPVSSVTEPPAGPTEAAIVAASPDTELSPPATALAPPVTAPAGASTSERAASEWFAAVTSQIEVVEGQGWDVGDGEDKDLIGLSSIADPPDNHLDAEARAQLYWDDDVHWTDDDDNDITAAAALGELDLGELGEREGAPGVATFLDARPMMEVPIQASGVLDAERLIAQRDFADAERVLRAAQVRSPGDPRSLEALLMLLAFTGRQAEAAKLIDYRLKEFPQDRNVIQVGILFHRRMETGDLTMVLNDSLGALFKSLVTSDPASIGGGIEKHAMESSVAPADSQPRFVAVPADDQAGHRKAKSRRHP